MSTIAWSILHTAIRRGDIPKATEFDCVDCGGPAYCYDHRDYNRPLDVDPVCTPCNMKRGPAIKRPDEDDRDKRTRRKGSRMKSENVRSIMFNVRLSPSQNEKALRMCKEMRMNKSDLMRWLLNRVRG